MTTPAPADALPPRRRAVAWLVASVVAAAIAVPALFSAYAAYLSLTGAPFLGDASEPEVLVGLLWTACCLVLLALPVVAWHVAARLSLRPEHRVRNAWWGLTLVVVLLVARWWLGPVV